LDEWAYQRGIKLFFISPGKPVENCYIESFNGKLRDECLNMSWFMDLNHARRILEEWRIDYNTQRPHSSLDYLTPDEFLQKENEKTIAIAPKESASLVKLTMVQ
jgi:putative transposase